MDTVAFLGLGAMGSRMAQRLLGQGHTLKVWNRSPGPAEALAERGAVRAATPREAAAGADVVISIVSDDRAARSVWLDAEAGACAGLGPGALAVESSSVTPAWILELGAAVRAAGADLVDAQVTGSRPQAEAGQLIYMIGGEEAGFERAREILKPLGSAFYHIGPLGKGSIFKLAVNALFAAQLASVAELLGDARQERHRRADGGGDVDALPDPESRDGRQRAPDGRAPHVSLVHHRPDDERPRLRARGGEGGRRTGSDRRGLTQRL